MKEPFGDGSFAPYCGCSLTGIISTGGIIVSEEEQKKNK
jgi:hypothetical protein